MRLENQEMDQTNGPMNEIDSQIAALVDSLAAWGVNDWVVTCVAGVAKLQFRAGFDPDEWHGIDGAMEAGEGAAES